MPRHRSRGTSNRDRIAKSFYDSKLRHNPTLRRQCSDRHVLDETIDKWKAEERLDGKPILGVSRSDIIFSLKGRWKLIDSKLTQENIIIWKEDVVGRTNNNNSNNNIINEFGDVRVPSFPSIITVLDKSTLIAQTVERIQKSRKELESNRNGIVISDIEWENIVCRLGVRITQEVLIQNESEIDVLCTIQSDALRDKAILVEGETGVNLYAGASHCIRISFLPMTIGVTKSLLRFNFAPVDFDEEDSIDDTFSIVRYISIRAGDPDDYDIIKPTAPYVKKQRRREDEDKFSNPVREKSAVVGAMAPFVKPLGPYTIPRDFGRFTFPEKEAIRRIHELYGTGLFGGEWDVGVERQIDYPSYLTMENYTKCLQHLFWVEESQMNIDIRTFDLDDAVLTKEGGRYFKLHIPGLAESRPSVLKGDKILIFVKGGRSNKFEGIVHRTTQEHAIIDFPRSFSQIFITGLRVDVRFTFSRTTLRTSHQALSAMIPNGENLLRRMLFPQLGDVMENPLNSRIIRTSQLNFFNRTLNREQQMAVVGIVQSVARPAPYLIYGPPGTGKTVTLVESILQTLRAVGSDQNSRVLICAPSNTAVDVVVERLAPFITRSDLLRLNAFSRDKASMPTSIIDFTQYDDEEQCFITPEPHVIKSYKIVATTVSYGGRLPNFGILDHFTHIFIDEAGHSVECETLGCLALATKQTTSDKPAIVLAGDPKQLGPIIRSNIAKKFGLEKSLLERLSQMQPYARHEEADYFGDHYDTRMITKLVRNYRSHPTILDVCNRAFYDGDLIAEADITRTHRFVDWEHLPKKKFPIIFHGVEGEDTREANSPSWFNPDEAQYVKMYVDLLIKDTRRNKCKPEDIGIIAPYHRQVQKIRMLLCAHGYSDCKVGSVEEFQGSERPVIIISTVRSTVDYIQFDKLHKLGFLANEKRFNVAVTRAQSLLIMIGNPFTLEQDANWRSMIEYVVDRGGYTGVDYIKKSQRNNDGHAIEELTRGLCGLLVEDEENGPAVGHVTAQEGPAWRSEE